MWADHSRTVVGKGKDGCSRETEESRRDGRDKVFAIDC